MLFRTVITEDTQAETFKEALANTLARIRSEETAATVERLLDGTVQAYEIQTMTELDPPDVDIDGGGDAYVDFIDHFLREASDSLDTLPHVVDAKREGLLGDLREAGLAGVHTQVLIAAMHLGTLIEFLKNATDREVPGRVVERKGYDDMGGPFSATDMLLCAAPALAVAASHLASAHQWCKLQVKKEEGIG